eukprot:635809-Pleurochrysis_carterae.AAC.1
MMRLYQVSQPVIIGKCTLVANSSQHSDRITDLSPLRDVSMLAVLSISWLQFRMTEERITQNWKVRQLRRSKQRTLDFASRDEQVSHTLLQSVCRMTIH